MLAACDLFVHASRAEGNSNAILEAMAAGLPVVATRVGGVADVIKDGVHGMLVPPENAQAIAGAVNQLLADPVRRRMIRTAAIVRIRE